MSHGAEPIKKDKIESIDTQKWVNLLKPIFVFLCLCTLYFTRNSTHTSARESSSLAISDNTEIQTLILSRLSFNSAGYAVQELSKKTQIQLDIPAQFDIDGTAEIDGTCTIKDRKLISGTLPPEKEFYLIEPLSKKISITFKKN